MSSDGTAEVTVGCNKASGFKITETLAAFSCTAFDRKGNDVAPLNDINICIIIGDVRVR